MTNAGASAPAQIVDMNPLRGAPCFGSVTALHVSSALAQKPATDPLR
jgi:hypothetical protein